MFLVTGWIFHTYFQAEARLAARRQARAEAREIRMRELERQQKEAEENADRVYDMCTGNFKKYRFLFLIVRFAKANYRATFFSKYLPIYILL